MAAMKTPVCDFAKSDSDRLPCSQEKMVFVVVKC